MSTLKHVGDGVIINTDREGYERAKARKAERIRRMLEEKEANVKATRLEKTVQDLVARVEKLEKKCL